MLLIKIGGGKEINWEGICSDVVHLQKTEKMVLIHGASVHRDEISARMTVPVKTVISPSGVSSVYTDQKALEIFLMAYPGLVNKQIVARLQSHGVNAVGLSGVDGRLWLAKSKKKILVKEGEKTKLMTGNLTGRVEEINIGLLNLLLGSGYLPVVCAPALSYENEIVNTDNDWAVAVMAKALGVKKLVSLFEARGLMKNPDDDNSLISSIDKRKIANYMPFAHQRMKKKVLGAQKALEEGVEVIYWGDGRIPHPIQSALQGNGTIIK
jgi:acetylglutamate/LysW-gamma-L-alpha-aminoadipate kinase